MGDLLMAAAPDWSNVQKTDNFMTVYLQLKDSGGNVISNTNSQLGIFEGANLVGCLTLVNGPKGPIFMGPVTASKPSVTGLTIQLYNAATDSISTVPQTLNFQHLMPAGSFDNPAQAQTIDFPTLGLVSYSAGLTTNLGATASSGLAVSYSTTNANLISISGNMAAVLGTGTATIVASQMGNSNYLTAAPVTNTLVIGKGAASVSFSGTNATYDGTAKAVTLVTTPAGLFNTVTYNGSTNRPTNAGSYAVIATVTDANYTGGGSAVLSIIQASNSITFPGLGARFYTNGLTIGLGATASSGLAITYSSASTNVSISGTNVTVLGAGTASIVASQSGNSNYLAATPVTNTLVISNAATPTNVPVIYEQGWTGWIGPKEKR
jgi:hypothetical protein